MGEIEDLVLSCHFFIYLWTKLAFHTLHRVFEKWSLVVTSPQRFSPESAATLTFVERFNVLQVIVLIHSASFSAPIRLCAAELATSWGATVELKGRWYLIYIQVVPKSMLKGLYVAIYMYESPFNWPCVSGLQRGVKNETIPISLCWL